MRDKIKRQSFNQRNRKSFSGSFKVNKKEEKNKVFIMFGLLVVLFLILALVYFLLFSTYFKIKEIIVEGASNKTEQIKEVAEGQIEGGKAIFSQKNIIIFNKNKLLKNLSSFNFATIRLKKNLWKRHLIIKISEREEAILYLENGEYYFLDKIGNVVKSQTSCAKIKKNLENQLLDQASAEDSFNSSSSDEVEDQNPPQEIIRLEDSNCLEFDNKFKEGNFLPIIENNSETNKISENKKYIKLEEEYVVFVFKLYNDLNNSSEFGFKKIILNDEYNTIKVRLNNDLDIYLNLKDDYLEQISRFFTLIRERASELSGKKYIDLRYGDKTFCY